MSAESLPPREWRSRLSLAKWTSIPWSMSSPRSAQSLRFRALRSILWMMTPSAFPCLRSLSIWLKTRRPRLDAVVDAQGQLQVPSEVFLGFFQLFVAEAGVEIADCRATLFPWLVAVHATTVADNHIAPKAGALVLRGKVDSSGSC